MSELKSCIFDIQRFSLHDGPGIRTTVFFKGCNLRCFWCHNPESLNPRPEIQEYSYRCIGCKRCLVVCRNAALIQENHAIRYLRDRCSSCFACVQECFALARVVSGKEMTVGEVLQAILQDKPFYRGSAGGVTCSGGEPLLQVSFLQELFLKLREEGIHVAVDTAGNVPFSYFQKILPLTNLFLFDLKTMDTDLHKQATGSFNTLILDNLRKLTEEKAQIIVRIPLIPGFNDSEEQIRSMGWFLSRLSSPVAAEVLPFHQMGEGKYRSLGLEFPAADRREPTRKDLETARRILAEYDIPDRFC